MNKICLYHRDADGCAAAAVIMLAFPDEDIECVSVQYCESPPDNLKGRHVIIVDFSYPREVMERIIAESANTEVYDHHKSAQSELSGLPNVVFDGTKSGATLVWSVFFPGEPVPMFLQYIEDRDLWKFELPESKEHSLGLMLYPLDVRQYTENITGNVSQELIFEGRTIKRYQEQQIKRVLKQNPVMTELAGYTVPCINHTDSNTLSDVCGELAKNYPFAACYADREGKRIYSLRSDKNGVDVSEIAKKFGGGGHRHAAGFERRQL